MRNIPTYDEYMAFVYLTDVCNITDIKLSDKPDIISLDEVTLGIEVVSAIPNGDKKLESYYHKINNGKDASKLRNNLEQEGYTFNGYGAVGVGLHDSDIELPNSMHINKSIDKIYVELDKKYNKQSKYHKTIKFGVFIDCHLLYDTQDKLKPICTKIYNKYSDKMDVIYFNIIDSNIICKVTKQDFMLYNYDKQQHELSIKANNLRKEVVD